MVEIFVNEERKISNVTIAGKNISLVSEITRDLNDTVERISGRIQSHEDVNAFIGDVSYVKNNDEQGTVTFYVNSTPEFLTEATELGIEGFKLILNP